MTENEGDGMGISRLVFRIAVGTSKSRGLFFDRVLDFEDEEEEELDFEFEFALDFDEEDLALALLERDLRSSSGKGSVMSEEVRICSRENLRKRRFVGVLK